jgi:hypothetical protein
MSTIYDHAARALQPIFKEASTSGVNKGYPLAYCCDGWCGDPTCDQCPEPCEHQTCAVVHALARAGLLAYAPSED